MLQHRNMQKLLSPVVLHIQQETTAEVWCRGISLFFVSAVKSVCLMVVGTMNDLKQIELTRIRKAALNFITLSSDMKTTVVDSKLRELAAEIKKVLAKKNALVGVLLFNFQTQ